MVTKILNGNWIRQLMVLAANTYYKFIEQISKRNIRIREEKAHLVGVCSFFSDVSSVSQGQFHSGFA